MSTAHDSIPTRINPRQVMRDRRKLHFDNLAEILAEARRLSELVNGTNTVRRDLAGPEVQIVHLGNMPLGQMLGHLGLVLGLSLRGTAYRFPPPMRLLMGLCKKRFLKGQMAVPVEAPAALNREILPEPWLDAASGLRILQQSFADFESADSYRPNIMFGELRREEWIAITCRHAEWHLGFILVV
jgi:hypothetical protein